jgi:hypothetical protein
MKTLNEKQAAYLAGFIDADGSIIAQIVKRPDYVLKFQIRVSILFIQKKARIYFLHQIQSELGDIGTVRDRGDGIAEFAVVGITNTCELLKQIRPFLRLKQKQADLIIRICQQLTLTKNDPERFLELCELADQVAALNDSKNRSITTQTVKETFQDLGFV